MSICFLDVESSELKITPREDSHVKGAGMSSSRLVRGVNFGFWSHSGFSGQNAII